MLCAGIAGRPNVGKSTLFNALTQSRKAIVVTVPDERLEVPAKISRAQKIIPKSRCPYYRRPFQNENRPPT